MMLSLLKRDLAESIFESFARFSLFRFHARGTGGPWRPSAQPTAIPHPGTWYGSGPGMFREHRDIPVWCSWPEQDLSAIHYAHGTGDEELAVTVS
jgi:hypothetical protein